MYKSGIGVVTGQSPARQSADRREMAASLRRATLRAITSALAHDIAQPLAAIAMDASAGLRWLNRPEPDIEEARAAFKRIVREGHRAGEMIGGIRSRFAETSSESRAAHLADVVADVVDMLGRDLEVCEVSVQSKLPSKLPQVLADRTALHLLFFNLLANAIEAMEAVTGRERTLTLTAHIAEAGDLLVAVEDTGSGIGSAEADRLFEAFFTTKTGHAGLGLSICRKVVEAHGGRLWAAAREPHGTAFFVRLPATSSRDRRAV
jgi:signal transduction histidine kinase